MLIPIELVEVALEREPSEEPQGERRLGIDPARYGKNRTTYVLRHGNRIEHIAVHAKESTMKTAGGAQVYQKAWNVDWIFVDVVGLGAGVFFYARQDLGPWASRYRWQVGVWADHHAGGSIKLKLTLEADPIEVQRQVLALADALRRKGVVG